MKSERDLSCCILPSLARRFIRPLENANIRMPFPPTKTKAKETSLAEFIHEAFIRLFCRVVISHAHHPATQTPA